MTGFSVIIGFALGLPALASQAFGAGNYRRCGELLQRTMLIHLCVILPLVTLAWLNAERLLLAMRQPPAIAALTQEFLLWRLPSLPFFALSYDISNFLKVVYFYSVTTFLHFKN